METFSFAVRLWHDYPSLYAKKVVSTKQSHHLPPGINIKLIPSCHRLIAPPLLENLAIRPLVRLPILDDRLVPTPHVLDEFLVCRVAGVQLGELVAVVVGSDFESGCGFLATDQEYPFDDRGIGFAKDGGTAEDVFAGGFEAGEETT